NHCEEEHHHDDSNDAALCFRSIFHFLFYDLVILIDFYCQSWWSNDKNKSCSRLVAVDCHYGVILA
ncbi:MAG: hypothetical protein MR706_09070, partial [Prevotella sp.]|nr:hypothetical protein [Prevotella sp.]